VRPRSSPFVGGSSRLYPELSGGRIIILGQLDRRRGLSPKPPAGRVQTLEPPHATPGVHVTSHGSRPCGHGVPQPGSEPKQVPLKLAGMFTVAGLMHRTDHRDRAAPEASIENLDGTRQTRRRSYHPRRTGPLLLPQRPQVHQHELGLGAVEDGQKLLMQPFHRSAAESTRRMDLAQDIRATAAMRVPPPPCQSSPG